MHLNCDYMESPDENHEMLEAESHGLAGRVADLERKVLEQGDELVCLKATLAEALRRISTLEGMRQPSSPSSPLSTPVRINGTIKDPTSARNRSLSYAPRSEARKIMQSSLPQRKAMHYQSTGSLHSHSDSHSSSSISPIPSPSPRATPLPVSSVKKQLNGLASPAQLHKRWSSTGDFNAGGVSTSPNNNIQSKFSNKSFSNLYKPNSFSQPFFKHGTREARYNEEEKIVTMYVHGKSILLYGPSNLDNYDLTKVSKAPTEKLKLDWVYGYRGKDCRSNLHFLPTGEMVYFVAAVVVLYNVEEQTQRHYLGHTDDIKSIAIHPNKMLVATGQGNSSNDRRDIRPHIRVWNSVSLTTQAIIGMNEFDGAICCLSFSKADGGNLLVAIEDLSDRVISVWDWQKGEHGNKITETKCSVDPIIAAEFHPLERNTIVTCGRGHMAFWTLDVGGMLFKRMGVFEVREKPKYITCIAFLQTGETITGDSNGNLTIWGRGTNTIWKTIKNVHTGGIFSICVLKDGSVVTGGGKDGKIFVFDNNLQESHEFSQIELHFGGVRVISEGRGSQLLIGTTKNCILCGNPQLGFQPIVLGHCDELWGLGAHPAVPQFATAGHDRVLQLWDSMSHSILWSKDIGEPAIAVAFSPNGDRVLVGCYSGLWMIFDTQTRDLLGSHTDGSEAIQAIAFSPDGTMVALGSRDGQIYIYQVSNDGRKYARIGKCGGSSRPSRRKSAVFGGHTGYITHIDWAMDNQTLRSNSSENELLYWNASTCRPIMPPSDLRDFQWATNTCTLTFTSLGIWPETIDGGEVFACDKSHNSKLIAAVDDAGKVKLYSYPAIQPKSLCHVYNGHSGVATNIKFLHDDKRTITIGGKDTAVMQWIIS